MAWGPDRRGGPPEAIFSVFSKMGTKIGFQKWGPKMRSKMGSKNGVQQLPSLRAATTTNKNEKSPLSVSSGSGYWPVAGGLGLTWNSMSNLHFPKVFTYFHTFPRIPPKMPQDGAKRPQDRPKTAPGRPQNAQDGPRTVPRWPQDAPGRPKTGPKRPQDVP